MDALTPCGARGKGGAPGGHSKNFYRSVGHCGSGELLLRMYTEGFENLSSVDPFIEADIRYPCGVLIEKSRLTT